MNNNEKFFRAIKRRNKKQIINMLKRGQDVNICNSNGITALQAVIGIGDLGLAKLLVKYGADINMPGEDGCTCLEHACVYEKVDIVSYLLLLKCDMLDDSLHCAACFGNVEIAAMLIQHGADVNRRNYSLRTPLHWAAQEGEIEVAEILIENGAEVNTLDDKGFSPLYNAAGENNYEFAEMLLNHGADIDYTEDATPFIIACAFENYESINVLLKYGADINRTDNDGRTALFYAKVRNNHDLIEFLLNHGADTSVVDNEGISVKDLDNEEIRSRLYRELYEWEI